MKQIHCKHVITVKTGVFNTLSYAVAKSQLIIRAAQTDLHAVDDGLGQEALEAHFFLQVLKVGFLVQCYLRHVLEEPSVAQEKSFCLPSVLVLHKCRQYILFRYNYIHE